MTIKEKQHLLGKINEKQQEINRRERRIDSIYKTEPFDEKRVDRLEETQLRAYDYRNGMIYAMNCILGRSAWLSQRPDDDTPGSGEWFIREA